MDFFRKINEEYSDYRRWLKKPSDILMSEREIEEFNKNILKEEKTNCFDLEKINNCRYGFSKNEFFIYLNKEEKESDRLSSVKIWEPVLISEEAGAWIKIYTYFYSGWCKKENIVFCKDFKEWEKLSNPSKNLTVTSYDVYSENGVKFSLGTTLPFADSNTESEKIKILLPSESEKKDFEIKYDFIGKENIYEKSLPFTSENILSISYKALGKKYVWGGLDCSGFVMDIFRCFGLKLPRDSSSQMNMISKALYIRNFCTEGKKMILKCLSPGSLIGFEGHIMLYLGEDNGEFYVINALSSFMLPNGKIQNPLCVAINPLSIRRKNGNIWLDEIDTIIDIKDFK